MAAPPLLTLTDILLTYGGAPVLDGAEISVLPGDRVTVVGRNGSGKSTMLRIAAGLMEPDRGKRFVKPGATMRYLAQEPDFGSHKTTLSFVEAGLGPNDDEYRARYLLEQLGLTGEEDPSKLSGGEGRRAALAQALAPEPDILLLDEPTNHLDVNVIEWLEAELASLKSALVLISHDRRFLTNLSRACVWIDRGRARRIDIGFGKFEAWRDETLAQEELERHKLDRRIVAEEHWVRYGVSGRRKRNVSRLAKLQDMRIERRTERRGVGQANLQAAEASASGKMVIEAKRIAKTFGERTVINDFSTRINRGDRLGVIGPNGAGKTTLISMLTGKLEPDAGTVRLGANIEMAALEQNRDSLNPNWTVAEALTNGSGDRVMVGGENKHVIGYMADFLFAPEQARTPLRVLSGGERARLMLARALAKPSNLLVLDEPTNDLDLETLDVLEEMLGDYAGTVILISHDRDFLDRLVSSTIAPEGDGEWVEYAGGYTDMLAQRGADLAARGAAGGSGGGRAARADAANGATHGSNSAENAGFALANAQANIAPAAESAPKRRLSFKDKHALETLPKTIANLEAKIAKLQTQLADPGLYARDRKTFDTATAALTQAQAELEASEVRWLELEM
ncbi:MAG: ATP-binding cassette domain-containing protein [Hyphomicrobiales bacterium]|nr:ATP-binding cassette domain-containing protein [Hyphomicrobiales bacterium]